MYKISEKKEINNKVEFQFTIEGQEWKKSQHTALLSLAKNVKIAGFRTGKAPASAARGAIDHTDLMNKAINVQINATIKEFASSTKENFIPDRPEVNVDEITDGKLVFTAAFESVPVVTLPDYKKFDLKLDSMEVSDEEVDHEFNRMIRKDIMLVPKESGTVQNGDSLSIDFIGYKDGVAFPGGSAKNQELEIGSHSFIPGFEEGLIGMKNGEKKSIELSFPKNYHDADLAGQKVQFDVTVNSISSIEKPKFDEQYFAKFKLENVKTEQEFKNYLKKQLIEWKQHKAEQEFQRRFTEMIIENTKVSYYPNSLLQIELRKIDDETYKEAEQKNLTKAEYLVSIGYTNNDLYEEGLKRAAERSIILVCAVEKIAEELEIKVDETDLEDYYSKIAKLYGMTERAVKAKYKNVDGIEAFLFQKKTYEKLFNFYK